MFSDVGILSQFKADWAEQLLIVSFVIGTKYYMDFLIQWNFCNICFDLPSQKIIFWTQTCFQAEFSSSKNWDWEFALSGWSSLEKKEKFLVPWSILGSRNFFKILIAAKSSKINGKPLAIRFFSYLSFCHMILRHLFYFYQKLKLNIKIFI